jgi:hypothetical protein
MLGNARDTREHRLHKDFVYKWMSQLCLDMPLHKKKKVKVASVGTREQEPDRA